MRVVNGKTTMYLLIAGHAIRRSVIHDLLPLQVPQSSLGA
jgi:hypothetical protein